LQEQVAASVVGAIAPQLERAEIERAKRKPTDSLDAYDYYLRGMTNFHQGTREAVNDATLSREQVHVRCLRPQTPLLPQESPRARFRAASSRGRATWPATSGKKRGWPRFTVAAQEGRDPVRALESASSASTG
jgi:hypothetical protein